MKEENIEQVPAWATALREEMNKLREENKMLKDFAGKNKQLAWAEAQKDKTQKFGHLKKFNDKIVIGWSNLDYSEYDPSAPTSIGEHIFTTLQYLDGSSERINYAHLKSFNEQVKVKILANSGHDLVIEFDEQVVAEYKLGKKTFEIPAKYINP